MIFGARGWGSHLWLEIPGSHCRVLPSPDWVNEAFIGLRIGNGGTVRERSVSPLSVRLLVLAVAQT